MSEKRKRYRVKITVVVTEADTSIQVGGVWLSTEGDLWSLYNGATETMKGAGNSLSAQLGRLSRAEDAANGG